MNTNIENPGLDNMCPSEPDSRFACLKRAFFRSETGELKLPIGLPFLGGILGLRSIPSHEVHISHIPGGGLTVTPPDLSKSRKPKYRIFVLPSFALNYSYLVGE